MTPEEIRDLGRHARELLSVAGTVRIEYQPGNGTRYDVVIVDGMMPRIGTSRYGSGTPTEGRWLVSVLNFGTIYTFPADTAPPSDYIAEKLCRSHGGTGNLADGEALHVLLAAVAGVEPRATLR